jgi:hypothetical protein
MGDGGVARSEPTELQALAGSTGTSTEQVFDVAATAHGELHAWSEKNVASVDAHCSPDGVHVHAHWAGGASMAPLGLASTRYPRGQAASSPARPS